jgi:3-hydroxypropionyl-coenzyme A dehydratase
MRYNNQIGNYNESYNLNLSNGLRLMKYIVKSQISNDIAIIKINRPEVLNALDNEVAAELYTAIEIAGMDDKIKAVIITGTGERSFCAGGDLRYVMNIDPIEAERYASFMHSLLNKIESLEKPVIAAINGYALGGGCQLALTCDIRIASNNAKIGQTEVTVGIPPGWGGTQRLLRIVGPAKAKELIYTGKIISANEAERIGLVNKVVSMTSEEKYRLLNMINTTTTANNSKEEILINRGMDTDIDIGLRLEIYGWALCFAHKDRQKMMLSFLNKGKRIKMET